VSLLYISTADPLPTVAQRVFGALDISDWEQRYSDNYPGGSYFVGKTGLFDVRVSQESPDDWMYDEFQMLVFIGIPSTLPTPPDEVAELAAVELLHAGFRVAQELDSTESLIRCRVFSLDEAGKLQSTMLERTLPS
jgi:hypothetical protein